MIEKTEVILVSEQSSFDKVVTVENKYLITIKPNLQSSLVPLYKDHRRKLSH